MTKVLILIVVVIAVAFAVGIGFGRRGERRVTARNFDSSQLSGGGLLSMFAGRVDRHAISAPCRQGNAFIVNPGTVCSATIASGGGTFHLNDTRNLTLVLNRGAGLDVTYNHGHRSAKPLDELDHQSGRLPTEQGKNSAKLVVLRFGGTLTLRCLGPETCVVEMQ